MRSSTLRAAPTASDPTSSQAALAPQDVPLDGLAPCVTGSLAGTGVAVPRWTLPDCPHQYPRRRPALITARMGNSSARDSLLKSCLAEPCRGTAPAFTTPSAT